MPLLVMTLVINNVSKHVPWIIRPVAEKITDGVKAGFVRPRMKRTYAISGTVFGRA